MSYQKKKQRIKDIILEHVYLNLKEYIIVLIIFVLGILLGMTLLQNLSDEQKQELVKYIDTSVGDFKNNIEIDKILLLKNSIINNIMLVIIMWFAGSTIIGLPIVYGVIIFKGFSLGYTISAIIAILGVRNGMLFVLTSMFLQNIILIPCLLALAVSATRFCKSILKDRKKENIKYGVIKHTLFSVIIILLLSVSALIEAYISTFLFEIGLKMF